MKQMKQSPLLSSAPVSVRKAAYPRIRMGRYSIDTDGNYIISNDIETITVTQDDRNEFGHLTWKEIKKLYEKA